jgi:hypothetical protein
MTSIVNPKIEVTVYGSDKLVLPAYYMEFDINKDLSEEPNTAGLTVYNMGPSDMQQLQTAEDQESPIEIRITPSDSSDLVIAYSGEITSVSSEFLNPGHATYIECDSQKANHRDFTIDMEFAAGTTEASIMNELVKAVGLPVVKRPDTDYGVTKTTMSETYTGPAFPSLRTFADRLAIRPYISDGILYLTAELDEAPNQTTVFVISPEMVLGYNQPQDTSRNDESLIELRTIVKSTGGDIFTPTRKNKKKEKAWGPGTTAEYVGVDRLVQGISLPVRCQPALATDQIIRVNLGDYKQKYFRVQSLNHHGDSETFDPWNTEIEADVFEGTVTE